MGTSFAEFRRRGFSTKDAKLSAASIWIWTSGWATTPIQVATVADVSAEALRRLRNAGASATNT
jgi:hypothetical protein